MNILIVFAKLLYDLTGIICILLVLNTAMLYKEKNRKRSAVFLSAASVLSLSTSVTTLQLSDSIADAVIIMGIISAALIIIIPQQILSVDRHIRPSVISFSVIALNEIIFGLFNIPFSIDIDTQKGYLTELLFISCTYIIVSVFIRIMSANKELSTVKNVVDTIPSWLLYMAAFFTFSAYCINGFRDEIKTNTVYERAFNIIYCINSLCIIICIAYFVYKIFSLSFQQTKILAQLSQQHDSYEEMLKSDEKLREFRHDYKNHMLVVTALLNNGKLREAEEYLEKIRIQSGIAQRTYSTGNFVADAILNNKIPLAEEYEIRIGFKGVIPEKGIDNTDLCTVISNLTDNAIESTKKYSGDKYIIFESYIRNGFLCISLRNPVNQKIEIKNNKIKTTKADRTNHGIGLRNVKATVEKYGGNMLLSCDEKEFTADINMKLVH